MVFILALQYALDILPSIRTSIDYTFILRESNTRTRKKLYDNYAPGFLKEDQFYTLLDVCTENYGCLVVNNTVQSNNIEDCVYWFRVDPKSIPENFKSAHNTCWRFNEERYDPNFVAPLIPMDEKKKRK